MIKNKIIISCVLLFFFLFFISCKKHHHNQHNPIQSNSQIKIESVKQIGYINEHIIDICKWGDAIFMAPYLRYTNGKIYILTKTGIHSESINSGKIESIYRVWVGKDNNVYCNTEQPPMIFGRFNNSWRRIKKFANHGWGVLGNISNKKKMNGQVGVIEIKLQKFSKMEYYFPL